MSGRKLIRFMGKILPVILCIALTALLAYFLVTDYQEEQMETIYLRQLIESQSET